MDANFGFVPPFLWQTVMRNYIRAEVDVFGFKFKKIYLSKNFLHIHYPISKIRKMFALERNLSGCFVMLPKLCIFLRIKVHIF